MRDITRWQRYRARRKALSVLQCAVCGEAALWEHRSRRPKLDQPGECTAFCRKIWFRNVSRYHSSEPPWCWSDKQRDCLRFTIICHRMLGHSIHIIIGKRKFRYEIAFSDVCTTCGSQRDAVSNGPCAASGFGSLLHLIVCSVREKIIMEHQVDSSSKHSAGSLLDFLRTAFTRFTLAKPRQRGILEAMQIHVRKFCRDPSKSLWIPRKSTISELSSGQYIHIGPEICIQRQLSKRHPLSDAVLMQLNCDCAKVFRSSNVQLWPILGRVIDPCCIPLLTVSLYCGEGKSPLLLDFLKECISELNVLLRNTIQFGSKCVRCTHSSVVCDTPARTFFRQVKGPTGYFSRDCYIQRGLHCDIRCETRDDNFFHTERHRKRHVGLSPVGFPPIDTICTFPLNYMHLVCRC